MGRERTVDPILGDALRVLLGAPDAFLFESMERARSGDTEALAVLSASRSATAETAIRHLGYERVQAFVVLPSLSHPRWLFPLNHRSLTLAAAGLYTPYRTRARALKLAWETLVRLGWTHWPLARLLVASQGPLPLARRVADLIDVADPVLAFSLGAPGRFRKLTVQVMRRSGEVLGFIKLPFTPAAADRIRFESEVLAKLWECASLRPHIPRVLSAGIWQGMPMLFQAPGPERPGPAAYGHLHRQFLQSLASVEQSEKLSDALVGEVAGRWRSEAGELDSDWQRLAEAALERARRELGSTPIPCGPSHGDFAPWNTKVDNNGLFLFDWESFSWDRPLGWDALHFFWQSHLLLGRPRLSTCLEVPDPVYGRCLRPFLPLYILVAVLRLSEERPPGWADHVRACASILRGNLSSSRARGGMPT